MVKLEWHVLRLFGLYTMNIILKWKLNLLTVWLASPRKQALQLYNEEKKKDFLKPNLISYQLNKVAERTFLSWVNSGPVLVIYPSPKQISVAELGVGRRVHLISTTCVVRKERTRSSPTIRPWVLTCERVLCITRKSNKAGGVAYNCHLVQWSQSLERLSLVTKVPHSQPVMESVMEPTSLNS